MDENAFDIVILHKERLKILGKKGLQFAKIYDKIIYI